MADGALQGRRAALNQFSHTDGNAQTVVEVPLPTVDGLYCVRAWMTGGTSSNTNRVGAALVGNFTMDGGAAIGSDDSTMSLKSMGATGYTVVLDASGGNARLRVTAANGHRSVGFIEVFGVELAITLA